jgi:hypothetical protein
MTPRPPSRQLLSGNLQAEEVERMRTVTLAVAATATALLTIACHDATEPAPEIKPEYDIGGSDFQCTGAASGIFDNVVVPEGGSCVLSNSTVQGSVKALAGSRLDMMNNQVRGNVFGDKANIVRVFGGTIGGSIEIKEANDPATGFVGVLGTMLTDGNIQLEKNNVASVFVLDAILLKGNIKVEENVGLFGISVIDNEVSQNLQVFKNQGPGNKFVLFNAVFQNLQCFENQPPFLGGPNFTNKAEGQCFPLGGGGE